MSDQVAESFEEDLKQAWRQYDDKKNELLRHGSEVMSNHLPTMQQMAQTGMRLVKGSSVSFIPPFANVAEALATFIVAFTRDGKRRDARIDITGKYVCLDDEKYEIAEVASINDAILVVFKRELGPPG